MADPWLTEEGEPCEALVKMGWPEWKSAAAEIKERLIRDRLGWGIAFRRSEGWVVDHHITPHEAHALIEKDQREKLAKRNLEVQSRVFFDNEGENPHTAFAVHNFATDNYLAERGAWDYDIHDVLEFATYTAALQAAALVEGEGP